MNFFSQIVKHVFSFSKSPKPLQFSEILLISAIRIKICKLLLWPSAVKKKSVKGGTPLRPISAPPLIQTWQYDPIPTAL